MMKGCAIMSCVFCSHIKSEQVKYKSNHFFIVFDIDPFQKGQMLIISKAHRMNYLELTSDEYIDFHRVLSKLISILEDDLNVGVTVIMNNGRQMDEGLHFHVHIIPRYSDDSFWDNVKPKSHEINIDYIVDKLVQSTMK